jgi:hypothetical protein
VSNTTGTDNVPGATRSGPLVGNNVFNETLTMYSAHPDALMYTYHGKAVTYPAPNGSPVYFHGYAETMRLDSICDGKGTYIDLITWVCADEQIAAYNIWYTAHASSFEGMAAGLGATVLAGDCPRMSISHFSGWLLTCYGTEE